MFRTTGVISKDFINEIKRYFIPVYIKILFMVFPLCFLPSLPFDSIGHILIDILVLCVMYAAIAAIYYVRRERIANLQLDRIYEVTGAYEIAYTISFEGDGIVVENHSTGANSKIKYDMLRRLVKRESFYVLFTASHQYIPIFTECLHDEEKAELLAYLKDRAPSLKW